MKFPTLKLTGLLLALSVVMTIKPVSAQQYSADDGRVEFISSAPLLEFSGISNHLAGLLDLDQKMVDFYVDLNTLETGIRRRDRDMRNSYLETDKYPFAEFTGQITSEFDPKLIEAQVVTAEGAFSLHGVERKIRVDGTLEPIGNDLELKAEWIVLLEDYNIDRPRVLFYELSEEQRVKISIRLKRTE